MSALGWAIVLSLPFYAFAQLWLIVVLGRRFASDEDGGMPRPGVEFYADTAEEPWPHTTAGVGAGDCRSCGATNDPAYTYCRVCTTPLARG